MNDHTTGCPPGCAVLHSPVKPYPLLGGRTNSESDVARLEAEVVRLQARLDGLVQVGWFVQHPHRHDYPQTPCGVFGEFRFMEQEDGCPISGKPIYILGGPSDV